MTARRSGNNGREAGIPGLGISGIADDGRSLPDTADGVTRQPDLSASTTGRPLMPKPRLKGQDRLYNCSSGKAD